MRSPQHIVIFHPAAIGDAMMATPVAMVLKKKFPQAKITYWSHSSLRPLVLDMCPYIDEFLDFKKTNIFALYLQFRKTKCDLFIDLSSSLRGTFLARFGMVPALVLKKQKPGDIAFGHIVDNFLDTVKDICPDIPEKLFPTLDADKVLSACLSPDMVQICETKNNLLAIVPGVGKLRPNRAWPLENWIELTRAVLKDGKFIPVFVGGPEEKEMGLELQKEFPDCLNLCGKLSLAQTACVLKSCKIVITADTGPAHIATAVGTPVIGLYGPTEAKRYAPYECIAIAIDKSGTCQCLYQKNCRVGDPSNSGECMKLIQTDQVIQRLETLTGV